MNTFHDDGQVTLYQGDVREVLRELPAESVNCVVTSPPYWSLRDYGVPPSVWGGEPECEHQWGEEVTGGESYTGSTRWQHTTNGRGEEQPDEKRLRTSTTRETRPEAWGETKQGQFCQRCGAWLGALGLEPTPELFVAHTVDVFREVNRVLRPDGTLWLNIGDSYASGGGSHGGESGLRPGRNDLGERAAAADVGFRGIRTTDAASKSATNAGSFIEGPNRRAQAGLKPKDLVGIPWMLAFALRADGWWLRQDIIWSKPNPMPESVTDRCTKAHEYLFLLSKSERYWYDADAIREPSSENANPRASKVEIERIVLARANGATLKEAGGGVTPKSAPAGSGIKANVSFHNATVVPMDSRNKRSVWHIPTAPFPEAHFATFPPALVEPCVLAGCPEGGTVLDPFIGSGTTAMVARRLGRRAVGIDLNPEYLAMAVRRIGSQQFLVPAESVAVGLDLGHGGER